VAQSGTDHCQLAAGQNAHSRNVLFFSRTFSDLISVGGFRNEKKRQIKSDVEPNERRLHRAAGPQKPGCQAGSSCSGMAFGARFPGIAVCPRAKLSCILNKRQPIIRAYVQTGILFIHVRCTHIVLLVTQGRRDTTIRWSFAKLFQSARLHFI